MIFPRLSSSSYSCTLIWAFLSWGVLGWGEVAFATTDTGFLVSDGDAFFDADDKVSDAKDPKRYAQIEAEQKGFEAAKKEFWKPKTSPPPTSPPNSKSYYQTICDAATGVCRKAYDVGSSATAAAVDAAGAPIRWAGAQAVRGTAEETDRQFKGELGQKTLTDVASKTTAAAVASAAQASQTPAVQKAVEQTANTAAYGAVRGGKDGLVGKKRPISSEKSTTSRKSLPSRTASQVSSKVKSGAKNPSYATTTIQCSSSSGKEGS